MKLYKNFIRFYSKLLIDINNINQEKELINSFNNCINFIDLSYFNSKSQYHINAFLSKINSIDSFMLSSAFTIFYSISLNILLIS